MEIGHCLCYIRVCVEWSKVHYLEAAMRGPGMRGIGRAVVALGDADWDFFLLDDEETYPEPGDFWMEPTADD